MRPPRVTELRKPEDWRLSMRVRIMLVEGTEVSPRRAREAFCRCEQTFERCTRDIVTVCYREERVLVFEALVGAGYELVDRCGLLR